MESVWPDNLERVEGDRRGYLTARRDGRSVKSAWAKHVNREWVNDMIYVHYLPTQEFIHGYIHKYFTGGHKKRKQTDEISCEAFKSHHLIKSRSNHGGVGLIIKGYVTLLGNDQNELFTGSSEGYDAQRPNMFNQSGINKGVMRRVPSTYVLDAEDYKMPVRGVSNEALLDNWEVVAIISEEQEDRDLITQKLRSEGYNYIPVLAPNSPKLWNFKNR
jgi:hypothetical protein